MNTTHFLNRIMGNVFGSQTTPALPTSYWIGLSTSAPSIDGTCSGEPSASGTGYSRVEFESSNMTDPSSGVISNSSAISFPESISNWGTVTHYVVYDAQTGGNLLFFNSLDSSRTVEENTVITFKAGSMTITLSNPT